MSRLRTVVIALAAFAARPGPAVAQEGLTQEEALGAAYPPPAIIERRTAFLGAGDRSEAARLAGLDEAEIPEIVTYYVALAGGRPAGYAYFDAHRVRTRREVLLVLVEPGGALRRIELFRFAEPPEYAPPEPWLRQFDGRGDLAELRSKRTIAGITGATLTARAVEDAARRVLALHRVVVMREEGVAVSREPPR